MREKVNKLIISIKFIIKCNLIKKEGYLIEDPQKELKKKSRKSRITKFFNPKKQSLHINLIKYLRHQSTWDMWKINKDRKRIP
jgi:hypothetical protein